MILSLTPQERLKLIRSGAITISRDTRPGLPLRITTEEQPERETPKPIEPVLKVLPDPQEPPKPQPPRKAPTCQQRGCDQPAKSNGDHAGHGRLCVEHAARLALKQRAYKARLEAARAFEPKAEKPHLPKPKSSSLSVRMNLEEWNLCYKLADAEGLPIEQWMRNTCLQAARLHINLKAQESPRT